MCYLKIFIILSLPRQHAVVLMAKRFLVKNTNYIGDVHCRGFWICFVVVVVWVGFFVCLFVCLFCFVFCCWVFVVVVVLCVCVFWCFFFLGGGGGASNFSACVTASSIVLRLEVMTLQTSLSSCTVLPLCPAVDSPSPTPSPQADPWGLTTGSSARETPILLQYVIWAKGRAVGMNGQIDWQAQQTSHLVCS